MKLLFLGDFQFGRDKDKSCPVNLPENLSSLFNKSDVLLFNLETVLLKPETNPNKHLLTDKSINIYTYGKRYLKYLRDKFKKPIFVSTINNHTFDYNIRGYLDTLDLLEKYHYNYTIGRSYYTDDRVIYLNATDHWTIIRGKNKIIKQNTKLWSNNCFVINSKSRELYLYQLIKKLRATTDKLIILTIHWGVNFHMENTYTNTYLDDNFNEFAENLIHLGVNIVFGHGAHHILYPPYKLYKKGLIIYGLGDCIGDFKYYPKFKTNLSMGLIYDTDTHDIEEYLISKEYITYKNKLKRVCGKAVIL